MELCTLHVILCYVILLHIHIRYINFGQSSDRLTSGQKHTNEQVPGTRKKDLATDGFRSMVET